MCLGAGGTERRGGHGGDGSGEGGTCEGEGEAPYGRAWRGSCARIWWHRVIRNTVKRGKYEEVILPLTKLGRLDCVRPPASRRWCWSGRGLRASSTTSTRSSGAPRGSPSTTRRAATSTTRSRSSTRRASCSGSCRDSAAPKFDLHRDVVDKVAMGTILEELIRRLNEALNENSAEHSTESPLRSDEHSSSPESPLTTSGCAVQLHRNAHVARAARHCRLGRGANALAPHRVRAIPYKPKPLRARPVHGQPPPYAAGVGGWSLTPVRRIAIVGAKSVGAKSAHHRPGGDQRLNLPANRQGALVIQRRLMGIHGAPGWPGTGQCRLSPKQQCSDRHSGAATRAMGPV